MIACFCLSHNNIGFSFLIVLTAFSHPGYSPLHLLKLHFYCNQSIDSSNTTTNKTRINMYQKFGKKSLSKLKFLIILFYFCYSLVYNLFNFNIYKFLSHVLIIVIFANNFNSFYFQRGIFDSFIFKIEFLFYF